MRDAEKKQRREFEQERKRAEREISKKDVPETENIHLYPGFCGCFMAMIGYLVYFNVVKAKTLSTVRTTPDRTPFRTGW